MSNDNTSANSTQVGGSHYKASIQHWDYVAANDLDYFQAQITKYVTRWKKKNGLQDLLKARHFLDKYIELSSITETNRTGMKIGLKPFVELETGLKVKRLTPGSTMPTRNKSNDAGLDLYSANKMEICILPGQSSTIPTGIALEIPEGYHGQIWTRSGLGAKHAIEVGAGIIDSGYRGELLVILRNFGTDPFYVSMGMKIAQLVLVETIFPTPYPVEILSDSTRGEAGFGSSGL